MSKAEREFHKWFVDRFQRTPLDNEVDNTIKETFCNAYNLGVQHTESAYSESVRRW